MVYRNALDPCSPITPTAFEDLFRGHGWEPGWTGAIHADHLYHSTAHEVIGIAAGDAILLLGGPGGRKVSVDAGDALLLPAGTGHCQLKASANFLAVGAHPSGSEWDVCDTPPTDAMRCHIATLSLPGRDPVLG